MIILRSGQEGTNKQPLTTLLSPFRSNLVHCEESSLFSLLMFSLFHVQVFKTGLLLTILECTNEEAATPGAEWKATDSTVAAGLTRVPKHLGFVLSIPFSH